MIDILLAILVMVRNLSVLNIALSLAVVLRTPRKEKLYADTI